MNFIAHYVIAQSIPVSLQSPLYVVGNALPDLLPLAAPRVRLRQASLANISEDNTIGIGAGVHLATDAAFHKTPSFARVSEEAFGLTAQAGFTAMRVRKFFLAHILVELALDAHLVRADPGLLDSFYSDFTAGDISKTAQWAERATHQELPRLPEVLQRFGQSQYLRQYRTDAGVAEGVHRLCLRARQDGFTGINAERLVRLVAEIIVGMTAYAPALLAETEQTLAQCSLTEKS